MFEPAPDTDTTGVATMGEVEVVPAQIITRFGPPTEGDGYKVSGEYIFVDQAGQPFVVHDWKSTSLWEESFSTPKEFWACEEPAELRISSRNLDTEEFKNWFLEQLGVGRGHFLQGKVEAAITTQFPRSQKPMVVRHVIAHLDQQGPHLLCLHAIDLAQPFIEVSGNVPTQGQTLIQAANGPFHQLALGNFDAVIVMDRTGDIQHLVSKFGSGPFLRLRGRFRGGGGLGKNNDDAKGEAKKR